MKVYTLGHGNQSMESFSTKLVREGVERLVDIRAHPFSRRNPQFNEDNLRAALESAQIEYHWAGRALGGMRKPQAGSLHIALEDESLRAYADHVQSDAFLRGVSQLLNLIKLGKMVLMCAEGDPSRCHRSILSDYLLLQGVEVVHWWGDSETAHSLHPCARRESSALIYDRLISADLFPKA